jgi:hypothetical protein
MDIPTNTDMERWLNEGKRQKATHMLVVCDSFDYEDYPVYVKKGENVREVIDRVCKPDNMQRLMEVYNLSMDIKKQLKKRTNMNY